VRQQYLQRAYAFRLVRCRACSFVYVPEPPAVDYDETYLELDHVITRADPIEVMKADGRLGAIAARVPPGPHVRLLDIGIGDGLFLSRAAKFGYVPYGFDVNPAGATVAQQLYDLHAVVETGTFSQAFAGTRFDVVHLNEVIEHIAEPISLLEAAREKLHRRGVLVVQTGNIDALVAKLRGKSWPYIKPAHISYFSRKTLLFAIRRSGFRPIGVSTIDWSLTQALTTANQVIKQGSLKSAVALMLITISAQLPDIRRSVIVQAVPV
jgi:2-polyprenyl-3-methyl-5-hydroxy-6-metoxy-1,4-benzoquinol methylase